MERISKVRKDEGKGTTRAVEALQLKHRLSDLVNETYRLTYEEVTLLWEIAPL
jgi:hypothetical protein